MEASKAKMTETNTSITEVCTSLSTYLSVEISASIDNFDSVKSKVS